MKFTQLLSSNMVPEWRNQYIRYHDLDSLLNKAIESKNFKSSFEAYESYQELLRFDHKFAYYFRYQCESELEKIEAFHSEKLLEMRGKYRNLEDQLDQVLSSALYTEIKSQSESAQSPIYVLSQVARDIKSKLKKTKAGGIQSYLRENVKNGFLQAADFRSKQQTNDSSASSLSETIDNDNQYSNCIFYQNNKFSALRGKLSNCFATSQDTNWSNQQDSSSSNDISIGMNGSSDAMLDTNKRLDSLEFVELSSNSSSLPINHQTHNQSKGKIVKSYKKKIIYLNFAYKELYFSLVLFEQYTQLNYTGFEQILRKYDRMFASTTGRKFFNEHVQVASFYHNLKQIDELIEGIEHLYTLHFENGNRRKAIEKLQVPPNVYKPLSPILDFRVGCELGAFLVLFVFVLWFGFSSDTAYDWRTVFRLYRSCLLLIIFLFQAGISLVIWKHYKINHVLIFELDPRKNLSYHHFFEFASLLGIVWSISVLFFLYSHKWSIKPSICPLVVVIIILIFLFNPTATGHSKARFWLLKILARVATAPFHSVTFADFYIADQLISIVPLFLDLEFLICFYTTDDVLSVSHLDKSHSRRCVTRNTQDLVIRTIVAAFPAWTRCAQCLRRWRDENWRPFHLCNAGKYACMVTVVILSSIAQYNKTTFELDIARICWIVAAIFTSALTAYWDIIYDFGLFNCFDAKDNDCKESNESKKAKLEARPSQNSVEDLFNSKTKKKKYPFLRSELVYPVWVYYFAIIEDLVLRFGWVFTISLTEFSGIEAGLVVSLLAPLEMFRRFVYNSIRLENEQLNNCGLFRAVRDIPLEVVAPIDESHVEKVITMMDSKDGTSMRNTRMAKRRTLRTDRVSLDTKYDILSESSRKPTVRL